MNYRIIRPSTHEGWLAERAKGIGSSDAGTIMGTSPFQTPYGLWLLKRGLAEPVKESDAMFNGHILEPATAEWFAAKTGAILDYSSEGDWIAADTEHDWRRVSPDRLYWEAGTPADRRTRENACVLELKSTSKIVDEDSIPVHWYCQVQYQLGVLGLKKASLCWISGSPTLHFGWAPIEFNPAFYNVLAEKIDHFWIDCVNGNEIPPDVTADDTIRRYPISASGVTAEADSETRAAWESLSAVRRQLKELEEKETELVDSLKMATGEAEALTFTDRETGEVKILATWKSSMKETVDWARLARAMPDLVGKYRKTEEQTSFDAKALKKDCPDIYIQYASKSPSGRKFLVK